MRGILTGLWRWEPLYRGVILCLLMRVGLSLWAVLAGRRVFLGHWAETLDWPERETQVATFFDATTTDPWRVALLCRHQITHVFHGPEERALGGFDPAAVPYLEPVFRRGEVTVYRVTTEEVP